MPEILPRIVASVALLTLCASATRAATIHVPGDQPTIQKGINAASAGDTILIAPGTYYEHGISLKSGTCLRSETGQWDCATIDGQSAGRVLNGTGLAFDTRIEGLTITGGAGLVQGAGMYVTNSSPTIARCRFTANSGHDFGGALRTSGTGTPVVEDCLFDANECYGSYDPMTGDGGAIYSGSASITLRRDVFRDNEAGDGGGAVAANGADVVDCVFSGNFTYWAGGALLGWNVHVSGGTFFGNSASRGVINSAATLLENSILAFGTDPVYCNGPVTVRCCDIYGNVDGDWIGCLEGLEGTNGNFSAEPLFCNAEANDFHLMDISPCAPAAQPDCGRIGAEDVGCEACPARFWLVRADGSGDLPTIQAAIDAAGCFRDTIALADGIYRGDGNRDLDLHGKPLVVRSLSGNADACVIDCQGSAESPHRGFSIGATSPGSPRIEGLTIVNGYAGPASGNGGGILCTAEEPTNNFPEITRCVIASCYADNWGGALCTGYRSPVIRDCRIIGNTARRGGGGLIFGSARPTIEGNVISGNTTPLNGGGIYFQSGCSPTGLIDNVITANSASTGGGVHFGYATYASMMRNTVSNNSAANAAGLYIDIYSHVQMDAGLVTFNSPGASIACGGYLSELNTRCSDIFGNTGGDWVGCIATQQGLNGNFAQDPLYCDAAAGHFGLLSASPCLPGQHPGGGDCALIGALPEGCHPPTTAVAPLTQVATPAANLSIEPPVPNPLNPAGTINYTIPASAEMGQVILRLFDATGRSVRTLVEKPETGGLHSVRWDGRDAAGQPSARAGFTSASSRGTGSALGSASSWFDRCARDSGSTSRAGVW